MSFETTVTTKLVAIECFKCHVLFGMTEYHDRRCRDDGSEFFCPNGHNLVYRETNVMKQRKRAEQLERQLAASQSSLLTVARDRDHQARRAVSLKGVVTRTRKRIASGKCPCCHHGFANLAAHMLRHHPGYGSDDA